MGSPYSEKGLASGERDSEMGGQGKRDRWKDLEGKQRTSAIKPVKKKWELYFYIRVMIL